jgi:hypothetical protein
MQFQARAVWQWSNFLHSHEAPAKRALHINYDETCIRLHQHPGRGFLVDVARAAKKTARSLTHEETKSQLRGSITHVAMICDDADVQKLLPQFVLIANHLMSAEQCTVLRDSAPSWIKYMRAKSSWMNSTVMVTVVKTLAECLADVLPHRTIYIFGDAYRAHLTKEVWKAFGRCGMRHCLIPAKLTWILQPCDTHLFASFKSRLASQCQQMICASADGKLTMPMLLDALQSVMLDTLHGKSWSAAFRQTGLVGRQTHVSRRVVDKLGAQQRPDVNSEIPSLMQLQACFPRNSTVPIGDVFSALAADDVSGAPPNIRGCARTTLVPMTASPAVIASTTRPGPVTRSASKALLAAVSEATMPPPASALPLLRLHRLPSIPKHDTTMPTP